MLLFLNSPTQAAESSSDLNLSVNSVVSLSITNCDATDASSVTLNIDPTNAGVFSSACQNISVAANTPGYSLSIKSSSTDLLYQNPTTLNPAPVVPSTTTGTIASPAVLPNDTWGFAVEKQAGMTNGFDTSYTIDNQNNKYALLPTTDQTIYQTDKALGETPTPLSDFRAFYGAKLTLNTVAGEYKTTITYSAIGEIVPCASYPEISFEDPDCVSTLQDFKASTCRNMAVGDTVTLADARDGTLYRVRKFMNENPALSEEDRASSVQCWMIDNLKLGNPESQMGILLTSADTDLNTISSFTLGANDTLGGDANQIFSPTSPNYTNNSAEPDYCKNGGMAYNSSLTGCGYYYSGYAVFALENGSNTNNRPNSICPSGWRLPLQARYAVGDFSILNASMNSDGTVSSSGYFTDSHVGNFSDPTKFSNVFAGYKHVGWSSQKAEYFSQRYISWVVSSNVDSGYSNSQVFYIEVRTNDVLIPTYYASLVGDGLSVRCLLRLE
jgi:uncharacterized protein (TIGR02145 family)